MISLMPYGSRHANTLAAIPAGGEDAYLQSWISSFKAWQESYPEGERPTILLRFGHEFNGNWYSWGNRPEAFKAAWRYVHAMFEAAGVNDHVEWVWCPSATDVDDYNDIRVYHPGDDVVDWTGLDGYNWGTNYSWTSWRNFDQVFSSAYNKLVDYYPDKPIILAEVASAEPSDIPNPDWGQRGTDNDAGEDKDLWVENMYNRIESDYPAIRATSWFNINKEVSWALNDTTRAGTANTGLAGYNTGTASDHFVSDYTRMAADFSDDLALISSKGEWLTPEPKAVAPTFWVQLLESMTQAAHAKNIKPSKEAKKALLDAKKATKAELKAEVKNLQRALALSRKPTVVGKQRLKIESDGFKKMPPGILKKIRRSREELLGD